MKTSRILLSILKFAFVFFFAFIGAAPLAKAATNLPFDQVTTGAINSPAQTNEYTFSANAGDVLNITVLTTKSTSGTLGPCLVLYDPNNKQVDTAGGSYNQDIEMFGYSATLTGTYTLLIRDCINSATGNYSAFLQKANAPVGASALPFATVTTGQISAATQSLPYTFSANADDVLNFTVVTTASTSGTLGPCLLLYNSTGTPVLDSAGGSYNTDIEMFGYQVKTSGTFNLLVRDCADSATGTMNVFLQKTNAPISAASILYSQQQPASIASASQSNAYTFIGTAKDVLTFTALTNKSTSGTLGPCLMIYNTTGTPELSSAGGSYNTNVTLNYTVPASGTYNVLLRDCADSAKGNYTLSVTCLGACILPVPAISSISPTGILAGSSGFTLTVNGSNFVNVNSQSVVQWNGADLTTTFVNTGQLTAQVPGTDLALCASIPITVFTPSPGGGTSNSKPFSVNCPVPTLTSIAPTSATAGSTTFSLTVNGTGFNSQSVVYWNNVALAITSVSSTALTATVPASDITTAGTASVTVMNPTPGGGTTSASTFTINNPSPVLSKIAPSPITAGNASATTLTATGSGFVSSSTVDWNGAALGTTYVSGTQLTASIPASDTACGVTANITVVNPSPVNSPGTSSALTFTANNPVPTLASISPINIAAGSGAFTLTIKGTNFLNKCSVAQWNGTPLATTFVSSTQLTATVPATDDATNGSANVTVVNPAPSGGTSGQQTFTIGPFPVPVLSTIAPISATAGGATFTLTVTGSSFVQKSTVNWNNTALTTTYVSSTKLTAQVPATDIATYGTSSITVVNPSPGGGPSSPQTFTIYNPKPTLSSISPTTTPAGGPAFTLTVGGSNFVPSSVVTWNTASLATTFATSIMMTAAVPAADIASILPTTVCVSNPQPVGSPSTSCLPFTIENPVAATPVIAPGAGSYGYALLVAITDATPGATIYFTTNGTTPTTSSNVYKGPFLLDSSITVEAMVTAPNFTNSQVASSAFVIGSSPSALIIPAESVKSSSAIVLALVNGHDLAGTVTFMYGASSPPTIPMPAQTLNASNSSVIFQAPITGLSAGATYYYQVAVTTPGGTSTSAILSFTTP